MFYNYILIINIINFYIIKTLDNMLNYNFPIMYLHIYIFLDNSALINVKKSSIDRSSSNLSHAFARAWFFIIQLYRKRIRSFPVFNIAKSLRVVACNSSNFSVHQKNWNKKIYIVYMENKMYLIFYKLLFVNRKYIKLTNKHTGIMIISKLMIYCTMISFN